MKIKDKNVGKIVDVYCKECPKYECYWPRQHPGTFTQGRGYSSPRIDWICGTREIRGCPDKLEIKEK